MLGIGVLIVLALVVGVVLIARRDAFREWRHRPIIWRGNTVLILLGVLIVTGAYPMTISLIGRHRLSQERDARLRLELSSRVTQAQVDDLVKGLKAYAKTQAELAKPTTKELARRSSLALMACAKTSRCRAQFTRVVNRVLRVTNGAIVPAPGTDGAPGAQAPTPSGATGPQGSAGASGPAGAQGAQGTMGKPGKDAKPIDSGLLDRIDNGLSSAESTIATLLGRIDSLTGRLNVVERILGVVCKLLTPGKCG